MNKKKTIFIILAITILCLLLIWFFFIYKENSNCVCDIETAISSESIGKITSTEQVKDAKLPNVLLYITGKDVHTFNNEQLNNVKHLVI